MALQQESLEREVLNMTNIATNTVPQTCKRYDSRILGKNSLWSNDSRETGLNSNILILGTSGCGNTKSSKS